MKRISQWCSLGLLFTLAAQAPAQHSRMPRSGGTGSRQSKGNPSKPQTAIADFTGTVQANNGKTLIIEGEESNTLQFNCNRKTQYFDGDKKIKSSDIQPGQYVSVAAKEALDASLDAVEVHIRKDKPKPKESEPPQ